MSNYSSSSSMKVSYETLLAEAVAKKAIKIISITQQPTTTTKQSSGYPVFVLPKVKDLTDKELNSKLLAVRKIPTDGERKGQPTAVVVGVKSYRIPSEGATWKYTMPDLRHRPDSEMYNKLCVAGLVNYAKPSTEMYRSNGTKRGLFKRLAEKLRVDGPVTSVKIANLVLVNRHEFESRLTGDSLILSGLNRNAATGLPYAFYPTDKNTLPKVTDLTYLPVEYSCLYGEPPTTLLTEPIPILEHALNIAKKMVNDIPEEASNLTEARLLAKNYFQKHPDQNTFMIKRKDEKTDRSDFLEKTRPYGALSLPTKLFCMWAVKPLEDCLANFIEDPRSISAYHYSHYHGGSTKIIEYFLNKLETFSGLAYGDDQLWQVNLKNKKVVLLAPDVSAMDMSTSNACVKDIIAFIGQNKDVRFPGVNIRALLVSLDLSFKQNLHLGGPFIVAKIHSLLSGVPGTTIINIFNSARIQTIISNYIADQVVEESNFFTILASALEQVKVRLGYTFKGFEKLSFEVAQLPKNQATFDSLMIKYKDLMVYTSKEVYSEFGIPLPFLSMVIKPFSLDGETRILSAPKDIFKLGNTLVLPDSYALKSAEKTLKTLERIAGAYFTGGWMDEEFSDFLHRQYNSLSTDQLVSFSISEIPSVGEEDLLRVMSYMTKAGLPSRKFMFDFNTLPRPIFDKLYTSNPDDVYEKSEIDLQSKPTTSTSKNEVSDDYVVDDEDLDELDKMFGFDHGETVATNKMGKANANTRNQEAAKLLRLKILKSRRAQENELLTYVSSKKKRAELQHVLDSAYGAEFDIDERLDAMGHFYDELQDQDMDDRENELVGRLKDSYESFFQHWDNFEEYEFNVNDVDTGEDLEDDQQYQDENLDNFVWGKGHRDG